MEKANAVFYTAKGIATNHIPPNNTFYIRENTNDEFYPSRFDYQGDEIISTLMNCCVKLYDLFRDKIFPDLREYDLYSLIVPIGIAEGGLNSDCAISKQFLKLFFEDESEECEVPFKRATPEIDKYKFHYAYMVDCHSLISTLQELILAANDSFIGFYKSLCAVPDAMGFEDTYFTINSEGRVVFNMLQSVIIQLYSIFDVTTKIAIEIENMKLCGNQYVKMASRGKLYGYKKNLKVDKTGTIFEGARVLSIIENLRNELIHNATWEMHPKVFFIKEGGNLIERRIHLPDFTEEGNLVTYKNRKRFFAEGKTVNEELPGLFLEVMNRLHITINKLMP